jgi:hypothetical protein
LRNDGYEKVHNTLHPKHKLVMVHRVDTERAYRFDDGNLYRIIRAMHAARTKASPE